MKWFLGICGVLLCLWMCSGFIFKAMVNRDVGGISQGIEASKKRAGSYVHDPKSKKRFRSYSEKYARGEI
jgi:hypothetical protein